MVRKTTKIEKKGKNTKKATIKLDKEKPHKQIYWKEPKRTEKEEKRRKNNKKSEEKGRWKSDKKKGEKCCKTDKKKNDLKNEKGD